MFWHFEFTDFIIDSFVFSQENLLDEFPENYFTDTSVLSLHLLSDSSLITITRSTYNDQRPGMCGSCDYGNTIVYHLNKEKTKSEIISSIYFNYGNGEGFYDLQENDSKSFFVNEADYSGIYIDKIFWLTDSILVYRIIDDGENVREFYLNFNIINNQIIPEMNIGDIILKQD